ncbi:hypothetical protein BDZ90DRAFT_221121 [Jaminaea rosea]|uniref:3-beta hydroxysteroid dehydrogenase/isomerase domain-containing protein n=1 Tax=Jaminaea rosea TaxID=1569628 RepID=A0A316UN02_9BASI|nr:hypothetical protein BDZ90DRAFT_221121 [Jaminaea rosea]PWN26682.1 hypothetical protein BDZ90DRAFT_221121 [Jaminaea rosea]
MSSSPATGETFLVIGGCGFLGHNLASALIGRGESKVHIVDVRPPPQHLLLDKATYHTGDITELNSIKDVIFKVKPDAIFHTASPVAVASLSQQIMEKVNVEGTRNVVEAAKATNVRKLIFTSSASVVFTGEDLVYGDERLPFPENIFDVYSQTKATAETIVLEANTPDSDKGVVPKTGLRTVAIRPAGIFGPNDRQAIPGFFNTLASGKSKYQIGNNTNLFDWTYVDNVSHAHLLASDRLETNGYDVRLLASFHLPRVLGEEERPERGVPTSERRPDVSGAKDYARSLPSTLSSTTREETLDVRPVVRNKYDQFFHFVHPDVPSPNSPLPEVPLTSEYIPVAGEAFFVTNGQPMPFWDFARALWSQVSPSFVASGGKPWVISKDIGLTLGGLSETFGWLTGKEVTLTKFKVAFSCATRYYNIEKARRVLGYEPRVGMQEAIKRSADWWMSTPDGQAFKAQEAGKKVAVAQ